eukprot:43918-Hanusia_phi.AAC.1
MEYVAVEEGKGGSGDAGEEGEEVFLPPPSSLLPPPAPKRLLFLLLLLILLHFPLFEICPGHLFVLSLPTIPPSSSISIHAAVPSPQLLYLSSPLLSSPLLSSPSSQLLSDSSPTSH